MAVETVQIRGRSGARAANVWAFVSDFARPWHPAVEHMHPETGAGGAVRRRFRLRGEHNKSYLEQLTYLSHSDRSMGYRALEGIDAVARYDGRLRVHDDGRGGSIVTWSARIEAQPQRAREIADGTRQIFAAGLDLLAGFDFPPPATGEAALEQVELQQIRIKGDVTLGLTLAPAGAHAADTICIFLHGIGGQRGNWNAQLAGIGALAPCVSLDLRGYGDSALGPDPTRIEDYFSDILAVGAYFKARRIILCGLSYGAWIATSFAMCHTERLAGLVLGAGCTGMSEADPDERAAFRRARQDPLDAGLTPADFAPGVVAAIAGPDAGAQVRRTLLDSMAAIPAVTYRDALTCFTNPGEFFDFTRISCPVLLMTGEYDQLAPPDEIRRVSQRMHAAAQSPDIRFEVIKGAGHVCNLEQPGAFNARLARFVQRIAGGKRMP